MARFEQELYIHIPFCLRKCRYCDFLSFPDAIGELGERYFDCLRKEIAAGGSAAPVRSIFFGGGTPGLASPGQLESVLEEISRHYDILPGCEITIETNPGAVCGDEGKMQAFRQMGFNRLSIGVQSLDDAVLKEMGRVHNAEQAREAFGFARKAGFDNVNLDLILGWPGQSVESYIATLRQILEMAPEHISAYSLIVEPGTQLEKDIAAGRAEEPDDGADRAMYHATLDMLAAAGYERYELSNFARPGRKSAHNTGYWIHVPYRGFGLGAASFDGRNRYRNTAVMGEYLRGVTRDERETEELGQDQLRDEYMMLGFRLAEGPDPDRFSELYGGEIMTFYGEKLERLDARGLTEPSHGGRSRRLSRKGLDLGNEVFGEFV